METTSYIALSRQTALWRQLDSVANNMANANTPGYKAEESMFTQYLVNTRSPERALGGKLAYVQDIGTLRDTREGALTETGNPLDIALSGEGYLEIDTPAGPRYSRGGHFRLDESGMVVTSQGYPVLQKGGQPIVIAPNESQISIAGDGTVSTENGRIGQLRVVKFDNEQELRKAGDGLYDAPTEGTDVERPQIAQAMIEQSNVQPVLEMTKMINITRAYESVGKMIEAEHERQMKAMQTLANVQRG